MENQMEKQMESEYIWMSRAEFEDPTLPYLFGAPSNPNSARTHSRRTKTADSLFPHLKDTLYRCKEYPHGIYINSFGQLCPEDSRSGLYQIDETGEVDIVNCSEEDDDNDNAPDEIDEELEEEEKTVFSKKRKLEESEDEWTEEEEEDDQESEDDEGEVDDEVDENVVEEESENLTQQQRKEAYLKALEDGVREQERMNKIMDEKKKQRIKDQKNLAILDDWIEEWKQIRNRAFRKRRALNKGAKNDTIVMTYDAHILLSTNPGCDFVFTKPGSDKEIKAKFDCETATIQCDDCEERFSNMQRLYEYLESRFV